MRVLRSLLQGAALLLCTETTLAASSWTFTDATISVQGKGSGVGSGLKERYVHRLIPFSFANTVSDLLPDKPLPSAVKLGATDSLKIILTTQEGKSAKRPHQAFLLLKDPSSDLDVSYPFSVKDSGKAKVELTQKDLPSQFLRSASSLSASIVLASFGSSTACNAPAFLLSVDVDSNSPSAGTSKPLRYGQLPEIRHVFRSDPKSPNIVIVLFFTGAVFTTVPILLGAWMYLGGNLNHLQKALSDAPISHTLFVGSIVGIEFIFFLYYTVWNLFQTLPVLGVAGLVAFLSGSRALTEVQERRLVGLR